MGLDVVGVGGVGHAGLPLAISLAKTGKKVCALDISEQKGDLILQGKMPFFEAGAEEVAPQLTVVMSTTAEPSIARLVRGAHAAWVVSSEGVERETTAVPEHSNHDR